MAAAVLASACLAGPTLRARDRDQLRSSGSALLARAIRRARSSIRSPWRAARDTARIAAVPARRRMSDGRLARRRSRGWTSFATRRSSVSSTSRSSRIAISASREARIREFRAAVGVARAPLVPSRRAQRLARARIRSSLGSFPPTSYRAARFTADLAWELDFWGRFAAAFRRQRGSRRAGSGGARHRAVARERRRDRAISSSSSSIRNAPSPSARSARGRRRSTLRARDTRAGTHLGARRAAVRGAGRGAGGDARAERARAAVTEHNLNVLLGEGPTAIPRRGSLTDAVEALAIPDSIPAALLARRPDVQQAERNVRRGARANRRRRRRALPTISIIGSLGVAGRHAEQRVRRQHARLSAVRRDFISSVRQRAARRTSPPRRALAPTRRRHRTSRRR